MNEAENNAAIVIEFLFKKQKQTYLAFAKGLVRDEDAAKDILSESIASVWERRDRIDDIESYLFITLKNNCLRYRRDRSLHPKVYDNISAVEGDFQEFYSKTIEDSSISKVYENEIFNILMNTLSEMPEDAREIFQMKKFEGRSYKEISEKLGVSTAKIDHTLRQVLQSLSKALKDYGPQVAIILAAIQESGISQSL